MTVQAPLSYISGGPEQRFLVEDICLDGDVVRGSMQTGPWLVGPDSRVGLGTLGVLADNVLGYALNTSRPAGAWPVSTEISLELLAPLPADGSRLIGEGRVISADDLSGYAAGTITNSAGQIVATCRQRGRYLQQTSPLDPQQHVVGTSAGGLADLLEVPHVDGAVITPLAFQMSTEHHNPIGSMHGGISLSLSDLVATSDRVNDGNALTTVGIHIAYVRAPRGTQVVEWASTPIHSGRSLRLTDVASTIGGKVHTSARVTAQAM